MRSLRNQSGSILVFVTLMIVLLLVMVGMGLDTGSLVFSRSMGQRAVDMAALAGAAGVAAGDPVAVQNNVGALNSTNDYVKSSGNAIDPTVNGNNVTLITYNYLTNTITGKTTDITKANGVRVALEQTGNSTLTYSTTNTAVNTPSFLAPLLNALPMFGFGSGAGAPGSNDVNVSAVAVIRGQPGLPIALNGCNPLWVGTNTEIPWNQAPSGGLNPNNSGWTTYLENAVSKPSVIDLIDEIAACGGTGGVSVGTNICLNNGQQNPDLREMEILIGMTEDGKQKCYLTPVIPATSNFTGCDNEILAYAQICPLAVCGPGVGGSKNQGLCTKPNSFGKYLVATVKSCNITDPNAPGVSSCYSLRLVREPQVGM